MGAPCAIRPDPRSRSRASLGGAAGVVRVGALAPGVGSAPVDGRDPSCTPPQPTMADMAKAAAKARGARTKENVTLQSATPDGFT